MLIDLLADSGRTSPAAGYGVMTIVGAIWLAGYAVACWRWPFRNCRKCKGEGRHMAQWGGRAWRACRRCKGTGTRLRAARWVFNYFWAKKNGAS